MKVKDISGECFGRWTVLGFAGTDPKTRNSMWRVRCSCGTEKVLSKSLLTRTRVPSRSCGCGVKRRVKHGLNEHPLYHVWESLKQRCFNPNHPNYHRYGGRGVEVAAAWADNPKEFIEWCMLNGWERGLEIDRVDNNGSYKPGNCRFVDRVTNNSNREMLKDPVTGCFIKSPLIKASGCDF